MRTTRTATLIAALAVMQLVGCAPTPKYDLAHHPFPDAQTDVREALWAMIRDAESGDVIGSREAHLDSEKFTKFGTRRYERQNFEQCMESETANLNSLEDFKYEPRELKIDVFGDVAVVTYYPHITAIKNGQAIQKSGRQTLVYVRTRAGWKIAHEHHSTRAGFEQGSEK